jgi:hypothetical protein
MKWESNPADLDIVVPAEPFNTPGNEVAPGSDVIRKQFKCCLISQEIRFTFFKIHLKKWGPMGIGPPNRGKS